MTHEEIEATIERLQAMVKPDGYCGNISDVICEFMEGTVSGRLLHDTLIALLQQADPDTHMGLPVDADGVPIHVGDVIVMEDGTTVYALAVNGNDFAYNYGCGVAITQAHNKHHYHKPTVEDVLREFGDEVQRCCDTEDAIAEYAAKLREVMADDDAR